MSLEKHQPVSGLYLAAGSGLVPLRAEGIDSERQDLAAGRSSDDERKQADCYQIPSSLCGVGIKV